MAQNKCMKTILKGNGDYFEQNSFDYNNYRCFELAACRSFQI